MNFNHIKYSRGQQITFVVLACFIVGSFVIDWKLNKNHNTKNNSFIADSTLLSKISLFETELDSFKWQQQREFSPQQKINLPRETFTFNPNTIDSIDIIRLGFKPFMAHNWLQYRRNGGKILSCKKLKNIYGIDSLLVDSLCNFMNFDSTKPIIKDSTQKYTPKDFFAFELNSADTTLLCKLPEIGHGRATMIVNRRNTLGGFYSSNQLKEIKNIPDSIVDNLAPYINIEFDSIKKININKCSIKRLHRHPYISYYQAKAIYDLRWDKEHKGFIRDLNELKKIFTEEEFKKVQWYLEIGDKELLVSDKKQINISD